MCVYYIRQFQSQDDFITFVVILLSRVLILKDWVTYYNKKKLNIRNTSFLDIAIILK